jgi:hypothetical protein
MKIEPKAGCPLGISGNSLHSTGLRNLESELIIPLFSPIFMIPNQKASNPVRPMAISKADFEESKVELTNVVNISVSPKNIVLQSATKKATTKKAIQI